MKNSKLKFDILNDRSEKMAGFIDKARKRAVRSLDQNNDGELDLNDIAVVADSIGEASKKTISHLKDTVDEKARTMELKALKPIFAVDLSSPEFALTKLIRITEPDAKHAESDLCRGSIGYMSVYNGLKMINLYPTQSGLLGVEFYPNTKNSVYYADPIDRDHYIALDEYFEYLKKARISELTRIAQDLGAKYFKVTSYEKKEDTVSHNRKLKASLEAPGPHAGLSKQEAARIENSMEGTLEAMSKFPGGRPQEPALKYLKHDPDIKQLIDSRLHETSPLQYKRITIEFRNSSGIQVEDAEKIDAFLKGLKISAGSNLTMMAKKESCYSLAYEVEF